MRNSLKLMIAGAALAGSINIASAADMPVKAVPPPPLYDWTGYWLGVGFGYMWGDATMNFAGGTVGSPGGLLGGTVRPEIENPIVSLHASHTHQLSRFGWGSFVIGLDNAATMPLDNNPGSFGNTGGVVACPNPAFNCGARIQGLFTTGAILGLAWDRVLLSVRGGYAGGLVETRTFVAGAGPFAPGALFDNTKTWHNGWYVGGGVDWAVYKTAGTSGVLGVEYQYVDLGDRVHCPTGCSVAIPGIARNVDVTANIIKAKFSVKFDGPPLLPF
jgi:outer membrane immunogenic protein